MKKIIIKASRIISEILISAVIIIGFITAYGAAVLQESYKLHPLSSAEIAEASGEVQLMTAEEDLNR